MSILEPTSRQPRQHLDAVRSTQRLRQLVTKRDLHDSRPGQARVLLRHAQMRTHVTLRPHWLPRTKPNACFANTIAALGRPEADDLSYVEGYAYLAGIDYAFEHAWLEDAAGTVIETTWSTPEHAYFGLPLQLEQLLDLLDLDDTEPFLFGDWARGFPLLGSHANCCDLPWFTRR